MMDGAKKKKKKKPILVENLFLSARDLRQVQRFMFQQDNRKNIEKDTLEWFKTKEAEGVRMAQPKPRAHSE